MFIPHIQYVHTIQYTHTYIHAYIHTYKHVRVQYGMHYNERYVRIRKGNFYSMFFKRTTHNHLLFV